MSKQMVCGRNAVEEAMREPDRVSRLLVARESHAPWLSDLIEQARAHQVRFEIVPQAKLNRLAGTREHQGVAAVISPVAYATLDECVAACGKTATLLALDGVQNPKNLGMLIRTALGAGAAGVLMPSHDGALLDEDVVRASAGAVLRSRIVLCGNLPQALRDLKEQGFWIYGLDARGGEDVFGLAWPDRTALVLGNETDGISPTVKKACDGLVRIPLAGGLESLNVVVAAGVALFHAYAQRLRAKDGQ